jgi:hypothetical protein
MEDAGLCRYLIGITNIHAVEKINWVEQPFVTGHTFKTKEVYKFMASQLSRQKHLIHRTRDRSYSMIRCTLDDCGNLINGRKLDLRFLPGIDTRRWETILPKSPLVASSTFFFLFNGFLCAFSHTHVHLPLHSLPATENKDLYKIINV